MRCSVLLIRCSSASKPFACYVSLQGVHYHEGMQAGENTLNALCSRLVTRGMARRGGYSQEGFLED